MLRLKVNKILACLICTLFFSCGNSIVYDQYQSIELPSWNKNKVYYFTFDIEDISNPYNLSLQIRNNNLYPYQNLWLFCSEEKPVGVLQKDTIECMLADEYGKWVGKGISLFQSSFPIRENYYFPHKGQYTFSFKQGMRNDALPGIQEIGFRVEKASLSSRGIEPKKDKK